jgi:hypothetical protein
MRIEGKDATCIVEEGCCDVIVAEIAICIEGEDAMCMVGGGGAVTL